MRRQLFLKAGSGLLPVLTHGGQIIVFHTGNKTGAIRKAL